MLKSTILLAAIAIFIFRLPILYFWFYQFHLQYFDCYLQHAALFIQTYYIINIIINFEPTTEWTNLPNHMSINVTFDLKQLPMRRLSLFLDRFSKLLFSRFLSRLKSIHKIFFMKIIICFKQKNKSSNIIVCLFTSSSWMRRYWFYVKNNFRNFHQIFTF